MILEAKLSGEDLSAGSMPSWRIAIQSALRHQRTNNIIGVVIAIAVLALVVAWLVRDTAILQTPPIISGDYIEALLYDAERINLEHFQLWYKANIVVQCTLIGSALLAAIFASVTTTENAESLKKWSVLLTAITAAMASFQGTFHIRENLETFIQTAVDMNMFEVDYLADRAKFADELRDKTATERNSKLLELHRSYMGRLNNILSNRMHALTNVGAQSTPRAIPAVNK